MYGKTRYTVVVLKYSSSPKVTHYNLIIKGQAEVSSFPKTNNNKKIVSSNINFKNTNTRDVSIPLSNNVPRSSQHSSIKSPRGHQGEGSPHCTSAGHFIRDLMWPSEQIHEAGNLPSTPIEKHQEEGGLWPRSYSWSIWCPRRALWGDEPLDLGKGIFALTEKLSYKWYFCSSF